MGSLIGDARWVQKTLFLQKRFWQVDRQDLVSAMRATAKASLVTYSEKPGLWSGMRARPTTRPGPPVAGSKTEFTTALMPAGGGASPRSWVESEVGTNVHMGLVAGSPGWTDRILVVRSQWSDLSDAITVIKPQWLDLTKIWSPRSGHQDRILEIRSQITKIQSSRSNYQGRITKSNHQGLILIRIRSPRFDDWDSIS